MNLNATLLVQMLCFVIFIWVTMRYIWPPMTRALESRRQKIAEGLAAAEDGKKALDLAEVKSREMLLDAKMQAAQVLEQAHQRANHIVEESRAHARTEGDRLIVLARGEVAQVYNEARDALLQEVAKMAVTGTEKVLRRQMDSAQQSRLIEEMVGEI